MTVIEVGEAVILAVAEQGVVVVHERIDGSLRQHRGHVDVLIEKNLELRVGRHRTAARCFPSGVYRLVERSEAERVPGWTVGITGFQLPEIRFVYLVKPLARCRAEAVSQELLVALLGIHVDADIGPVEVHADPGGQRRMIVRAVEPTD